MKWSEQPSDVEPALVTELLRTCSATDAVLLISRMQESAVVCLARACREGILAHLRSHNTELGGLLFGRAYTADRAFPIGWGPLVSIEGFLPSETFRSSSVSLTMGTEIWDRARQEMIREGTIVVGWYHSHPNLGAFFSCTDRATQGAFFNRAYSVGLVIDPRRCEEAWFIGPQSACLRRESVLDIGLREFSDDHTCLPKGEGEP